MKSGDLVAMGDRRQFSCILLRPYIDQHYTGHWWFLTSSGIKHGLVYEDEIVKIDDSPDIMET